MKKVITYGTYDLLHYGHVALLERAKALGDYLIVGVTSEAFDKTRGKLNVKQSLADRIEGIRKTGLADEIIVEEYEGQKIDDIQRYGVDIFTVGSDWVGKFDYLNDYCKVVYLERTQGISSTEIRVAQNPVVKIGLIALEEPVGRFIEECQAVSGVEVVAAFGEDEERMMSLCHQYAIAACKDSRMVYEQVDAVYISTTIDRHFKYIKEALLNGCHVLCESPLFMKKEEADWAFDYAKEHELVLLEAVKTMFYPAFEHLLPVIGTGVIGKVKDIEVSFSQMPDEDIRSKKYAGSMYDLGAYVLLPIIKILGKNYIDQQMFCYDEQDFSIFTKGMLQYPEAAATFKAGKGIKTEGNLVITRKSCHHRNKRLYLCSGTVVEDGLF